MASAEVVTRSRIVGTLSCQRDSYLQSLQAKVVSCKPYEPDSHSVANPKSKNKKSEVPKDTAVSSKTKWLIECDDSVLFPEGGGQPSDHGILKPLSDAPSDPIDINFVQRKGLHCVIHSPKPLEEGTSVRQEVNFTRRWDLMQQHTGQHLLSAVMNTYDNLNTLGWGMGAEGEMNYVDLARKPTDEELQEIQTKANDIIHQNLTITVEEQDNASTEKIPDDYDTERGVIRVIKIGDLDNNTCCGTHLQQTSHIGLLLLGPSTPASSSRTRQFFIAGTRALTLASTSTSTIRKIAQTLSTSTQPTEILSSLSKLQETTAHLKKRETKLLAEIAGYESERVKQLLTSNTTSDSKIAFVHRPEPGMEFVNIVAASVKDCIKEVDGVVVLVTGEEGGNSGGGAVLVIGARKERVEGVVAKIKQAFPGIKGGGKGERWQGKMATWKVGDIEILKGLVGA